MKIRVEIEGTKTDTMARRIKQFLRLTHNVEGRCLERGERQVYEFTLTTREGRHG